MNLLKRMGIITDEGEEDKVKPIKGNTKSTQPIAVTPVQTNFAVIDSSEDAQTYERIISEAIEKRDQPGPDFLEFYKALKNVDNLPISIDQKYKMAFGALSTMGLTKEIALSTHSMYLDAIKAEETDFNQSMKSWSAKEIDDKQTKAQKLAQENIELQAKIQSNMGEISQLNMDVAQNTQKLATKTNQFNATIQKEKSNIEAIVNNIKTYL